MQYHIKAEREILALLVQNPELYFDVRNRISLKDFSMGTATSANHRKMYEALIKGIEEERSVGSILLSSISGITEEVWDVYGSLEVNPRDLDSLVDLVKVSSVKRGLEYVGRKLTSIAGEEGGSDPGEFLSRAEDYIGQLNHVRIGRPTDSSHMSVIGSEYLQNVYEEANTPIEKKVVLGPFLDLNYYVRGFVRGTMNLIGARPGMGKTAFLSDIRRDALMNGMSAVTFIMEMSREQLISREISKITGIPMFDVQHGTFFGNDAKEKLFNEAYATVSSWDWHIFDVRNGVRDLRTLKEIARSVSTGKKIDLIDVDYIQLMVDNDRPVSNRTQELDNIANSLSDLSQELGVALLAASQLSRACEQRQDKRPMLSDLRDSGGLEQAAFTVLFLYRDDYYNGDGSDTPNIAEVIVAKNRNGKTGVVELYWEAERIQFRNLDQDDHGGLF